MNRDNREFKTRVIAQFSRLVIKELRLDKQIDQLADAIVNIHLKADELMGLFQKVAAGSLDGYAGEFASGLSRLEAIERSELSAALERNRWIIRKTARDLGLTARQVAYRVKKFGMDKEISTKRSQQRKKK